MPRLFDHIDLRVPDMSAVTEFYETLLPEIGFTRRCDIEGWLQYEGSNGEVTEFFGVTESPSHVPNENRIAFFASSIAEVDRLARVAVRVGARNMEGPMDYSPGYYAAFFEDPAGNRLEICHRYRRTA